MAPRRSSKKDLDNYDPNADNFDSIFDDEAELKKIRDKAEKKDKKKQHYVNSGEFYEQIKRYYETDILEDVLSESIHKIAVGLSFATNFINYSYKDEMIGDAVYKMFLALKNKKFDVDTKNNPFSYFTTIAFHAFINRIKREKRHRDTILRYQEAIFTEKILLDPSAKIYIPDKKGDDDDNSDD